MTLKAVECEHKTPHSQERSPLEGWRAATGWVGTCAARRNPPLRPSRGDLLRSMTLKVIYCEHKTPHSRKDPLWRGGAQRRGGSATRAARRNPPLRPSRGDLLRSMTLKVIYCEHKTPHSRKVPLWRGGAQRRGGSATRAARRNPPRLLSLRRLAIFFVADTAPSQQRELPSKQEQLCQLAPKRLRLCRS